MEEAAGSVSCILCSVNLPQRALALPLDPASILSFTKLLRRTERKPEIPLFSHSPYLLFCFNCQTKVHEIHEIFNKLENLREQLNALRIDVESELLRADCARGTWARNKSAALRHRILLELGLGVSSPESPGHFGEDFNQLEFMVEATVSELDEPIDDGDYEPDPDPCDAAGVEDYKPDSEEFDGDREDYDPPCHVPETDLDLPKQENFLLNKKSKTSTGQTVVLKPCRVQLGHRIDDPKLQPKSYKTLPKRCPLPGCTSKLQIDSRAQFAQHLKTHKGESTRNYRFNYDPSPMHSVSYELMKEKAGSIKFPAKCPTKNCISAKLFEYKNQLIRHLKSVHFKELKPLIVEPDLDDRINSATYPTQCFQSNCFRTLPFSTKDELRRHLRLTHFIRCKPPHYFDPILNEIKRTQYPTPCPREGCSRSIKIYEDRAQLRRHLRHVHGKSDSEALPLHSEQKFSSPYPSKKKRRSKSKRKGKSKRNVSSKKTTLTEVKIPSLHAEIPIDSLHAAAVEDTNEIVVLPEQHVDSIPKTSLRLKKQVVVYAESEDDEVQNSKEPSDEVGFKCHKPNCRSRNRVFKSELRYKAHLRYAHGELVRPESWKESHRQCQKPGCTSKLVFNHPYLYRAHMRAHALSEIRLMSNPKKAELTNQEYPTKCPKPNCESQKVYPDRDALRRHIRHVHEKNLQPHIVQDGLGEELAALTYPTKCFKPNCTSKLEFSNKSQLQRHLKSAHRIRAKHPPSLDALTMELKATEFPTRCIRKDCPKDKIYYVLDILRRHIKCFHDKVKKVPDPFLDNSFVCSICGQFFNSSISLRHHERQHDKTVNVTCEHCGAGFKLKSGLKAHMDAHHASVAPVFLCNQCPKTFKVKRLLDVHILRHYGVKKYFCRVCTKGYMYRIEVNEHERFVHWEELGLDPIKCHICQKTYSKMGILRMHLKSHTGNQRFACTECEYKTEHNNDLKEHVATVHQADFPYVCSVCDKKFKLERRLRQHELEHKDEYSNACELCDKRFATPRTLRIHNERKHGTLPASRDDHRHGILAEYTV